MEKAKVWVIWMAVMWSNLARNIADKWYRTAVYNRENDVTESFLKNHGKFKWKERIIIGLSWWNSLKLYYKELKDYFFC